MESKLEREVRFLKVYAFVATLVCGVFVLSAFTQQGRRQKFEEIDVERINVVERDGKLKLVLSNAERFPDLILDGKPTGARQGNTSAGLLFYNEKGDESGAILYGGALKDGKPSAGAGLYFDQFDQDQVVGLSYNESNGTRYAGLSVWDRPENLSTLELLKRMDAIRRMPEGAEKAAAQKRLREDAAVAQRVFVGKGRDRQAGVFLSDAKGKTRIRMQVDADGNPKLEFLDGEGKVVYRLPEPPANR
jgi:hypothetical protein